MWDAPSWIGSAISAKIGERNVKATNLSNEYIAELKAANDLAIAQLEVDAKNYATDQSFASAVAQRALDRELTEMKLTSNENIASHQIASNEFIVGQQIVSNENIERLKRELTSTENALNRTFNAEQNALSRENAIKVAEINAAANVGSNVIRTTPYIIPLFKNSNNNGKSSGNTSLPTATTGKVNVAEESKPINAKQKADSLFPDLEPTFSSSINKAARSAATAGLGAILVSAAAGLLTFVPFI